MVHKTWDGAKDQNCSQDYKTFPLLTTSKSVIINDVLPTSDMVRLAGVKKDELRPELVSTTEEDSLLLGLSAPLSILSRTLRSRDSRTWSFIN